MKANELRIGNYIESGHLREYPTLDNLLPVSEMVYEVEIVDGEFIQYLESNEKIGVHYFSHRYISLTEDWLLKLGFRKGTMDPNYIIGEDGNYYSVSYSEDGEWWFSNDESDAYCYRLRSIKHVHELQNCFFALTGDELTIKQLA